MVSGLEKQSLVDLDAYPDCVPPQPPQPPPHFERALACWQGRGRRCSSWQTECDPSAALYPLPPASHGPTARCWTHGGRPAPRIS